VRLRTAPGTHKCIAGLNTIAAGDIVYTAANGQVNKTATANTRVGVALEASSAVGDVIEVLMD
ncbi:MAG: capsid cement protein, partial [Phycisphaerae bacterium]